MKKLNLLPFILLFAFAVILPSCSNDDDDDATSNSFTFNGNTVDIVNGFLFPFGDNGNGSFDFDVYLTTDGITQGGAFGLTGIGDLVYLDLNSGSSTGLESGTYSWSSSRDPFTIVDGLVASDFDVTTNSGTSTDATGGTVEVEVNGNEVTLTIDLETTSGSRITGFYNGVLIQ